MPATKTKTDPACCAPKPDLRERPLITERQAREVMGLFQIFASESRLRLLHALLRASELKVNDLADAVGMSAQAVSNQLQRLVERGVLHSRRQGVCVYYRVVDPCVADLLDRGLCLAEDAKGRAS